MRVTFPNIGKELDMEPGSLVSDACERAGIPLDLVCGGNGTCGKCLVDIEENGTRSMVLGCQHRISSDMRVFADTVQKEHQLLVTESADDADFKPRLRKVSISRSALQAPMGGYDFECLELAVSLQGDVRVEPLAYDLLNKLSTLVHQSSCPQVAAIIDGSHIIDLREDDGNTRLMGLAVDIGTTSVVAFLYDLETGKLIDHRSTLNGQCRYGADVISRIEHTERDADRASSTWWPRFWISASSTGRAHSSKAYRAMRIHLVFG